MSSKRNFIVMIGLPGVGESTFLKDIESHYPGYTVIARDEVLEELRINHEKEHGGPFTRDQVFHQYKKEADVIYKEKILAALKKGENIILERPHNTPALRRESLEMAKAEENFDYKTTALIIPQPDEHTHLERVFNRALEERRFMALKYLALNELKLPQEGDGEFDEVVQLEKSSPYPLNWEYNTPHTMPQLVADARHWNAKPEEKAFIVALNKTPARTAAAAIKSGKLEAIEKAKMALGGDKNFEAALKADFPLVARAAIESGDRAMVELVKNIDGEDFFNAALKHSPDLTARYALISGKSEMITLAQRALGGEKAFAAALQSNPARTFTAAIKSGNQDMIVLAKEIINESDTDAAIKADPVWAAASAIESGKHEMVTLVKNTLGETGFVSALSGNPALAVQSAILSGNVDMLDLVGEATQQSIHDAILLDSAKAAEAALESGQKSMICLVQKSISANGRDIVCRAG